MEEQGLLDQLRQLWIVQRETGHVLALISPTHVLGMAAPLYTTWDAATDAVARHCLPLMTHPAPPLWQVARLLAEQGFAGLLIDESFPLFFVTTEPASDLPTHIAVPQDDGFFLIGEQGPTSLGPSDVQPWVNQSTFDRLSMMWVLGETIPFVGYQEDMRLIEYLPDGVPEILADKGLLLEAEQRGNGSIAFFSTPHAAEWYIENYTDALLTGEGEFAEQLVAHDALLERLEESYAALPHTALILNPGRHRFYQGFFRRVDGVWFLITINGIWLMTPPFRCTRVARRS
ncbi:MAG: hypothetical protein H0T73_09345 [Ardenticatenales bacterium]|nr:hypothetical protein [Ardenticatenales bacterium]